MSTKAITASAILDVRYLFCEDEMSEVRNILFLTHTRPDKMPPIHISPNQINAGPFWTREETDGKLRSVNLPVGYFDFQKLFNDIPVHQKPEIFIGTVDTSGCCTPRNVEFFCGPKILLVGDTHHLRHPISHLIIYCGIESYDSVVVMHNPQHLHWLLEAGISQSICIPNVNVVDYDIQPLYHRKAGVVFVGQRAKTWHPRRAKMLGHIEKKRLPLTCYEAHISEAVKIFSESQISFNCSLNGDLNMRIFETLSAGGCLVTDRLSSASGFHNMFKNQEHFFEYKDESELTDLLKRLLKDPALCRSVAEAGRAHYLANYSEDIRRGQLLQLANGFPIISMPQEPRCSPSLEGFGIDLGSRLCVYEYIQDLASKGLHPDIILDTDLGLRKIMDYSDLISVKKSVFNFNSENLFSINDIKGSLKTLCSGDQYDFPAKLNRNFDIAVVSPHTIIQDIVRVRRLSNLVAVLGSDPFYDEVSLSMRCHGYNPLVEYPWLFQAN